MPSYLGKHFAAVLCTAFTWTAAAADPNCPAYPAERRRAELAGLAVQRSAASMFPGKLDARRGATASANFIDDHIFGKIAAAGLEPAQRTDDPTFLRRVSLDLTGRIAQPAEVEAFLSDETLNKRQLLVERLMNSPEYVDYWTLYFGNLFQVTSGYYNYVGIPGRNLFNGYLREMVSRDRPYAEVARELITGAGDSHKSGPANFALRGIQQGDPIQDTWDTLTNQITVAFLGVETQCVSCHNGRRHLEQINLYLTEKRRSEFFGQSAFLSRLSIQTLSVDAFGQQTYSLLIDRPTGIYEGSVSANNPGQRPARIGTHEPSYMFSGQKPRSGQWRAELARILTEDRQFARAAVNYLWAHFFRQGIVDPPDAWDLSRIDPRNPPPAPWTLQPSHPELLEALTDEFIASRYSIKHMIRLMAQSNAYGLSSRYSGGWRPEYARLFLKQTPRRMMAEEIWDALTSSTETPLPMYIEGFSGPLTRAVQLPDPTEPRADGRVRTFLTNFGRGDWWRVPRDSESSVIQVLYLMNDNTINSRTFGSRLASDGAPRVARLAAAGASDRDAIHELFLATLGRRPTDEEAVLSARPAGRLREDWLSDLQWALLNKVEFLFVN